MGFANLIYCSYPCCVAETRFVMAVMCLLGTVLCYCQRGVLTIGIVEMVEQKIKNSTCPSKSGAPTVIHNIVGGKVDWTEGEQGLVLSAFFVGYLVSQVPAGILCDMYGPRYPLLIGYTVSTVATGLIPVVMMVERAWWPVFILRVITGAGQGSMPPGTSALISRWIPAHERTTIGAMCFAATSFGMILGTLGTSLLIKQLENWPIAFYFWAGVGIIYCILTGIYVFSDPRTHPFIDKLEFEYLKQVMTFKDDNKTPWGQILCDKCVYGISAVVMGHCLIIFTLSNNFPKYMNQVLGFPLLENGLISFIFILLFLGSFGFGILGDYLIKIKNVNVTFLRKLYTIISQLMSMAFFFAAVLMECNQLLSISCFALAIFFKGIFFAGAKVNIVDISRNHSGVLMSIINGVGAIMGFTCSYVIGAIAVTNSFAEWRLLCYLMIGFVLLTLLLYLFLSTAQRSDWDYGTNDPRAKKPVGWLKELSPEDHQARLANDESAKENRKKMAREAREKKKEAMRER